MEIQFLSFVLNQGEYALHISKAREVLEYKMITPVPNMPTYMLGVISLRGDAVPVMDLKLRLNLPPAPIDKDSSIIIIELEEGVNLGVLVDSVQEVLDVEEDKVQGPPSTGGELQLEREYVNGFLEITENRFIILLNLREIFAHSNPSLLPPDVLTQEDANR